MGAGYVALIGLVEHLKNTRYERMTTIKIAELKQSPYGFVGTERVDPTRDGIDRAIKEGRLSDRVMDRDYQAVVEVIRQNSNDPTEMNRLMREFHNERIAELVRTKDSWLGVTDRWPIKVNQFNQVIEGNHRFRAARFLGLEEIEVEVVDEVAPRPEYFFPEVW